MSHFLMSVLKLIKKTNKFLIQNIQLQDQLKFTSKLFL